MITLHVEVPYGSFRKSFARSFAETYPLPPPATVYGMLLSLVGERFRRRHTGVRLAFAYKCRGQNGFCPRNCLPYVATTLRKLSRFKYGVSTQNKLALGHKPDFIETLCGIEFLCFVDSTKEQKVTETRRSDLEERLTNTLMKPASVNRSGVLSLGLSDDAVNSVSLWNQFDGNWHRLLSKGSGSIELPVWVDHVGAAHTRWQRFEFETNASEITESPGGTNWAWTEINDPRLS